MADHDRSDRVPLPAGEARCEPQQDCTMRSRCARYSASLPQGTPLGDYSVDFMGGTALCPGFVDLKSLTKEPKPTKREVKPWPTSGDVL